MRRSVSRTAVIVIAVVGSSLATPAVWGHDPFPGAPVTVEQDQPILTHEECARGDRNGVRAYKSGQVSACVAAEGHVVAYAAGTPVPVCGGATVADVRPSPKDPNDCPESVPMFGYHRPVHRPDGVVIDGYIWLPADAVTAGIPVPIVLTSSPYFGSFKPPVHSPAVVDVDLIRGGFGVAVYSVRGTGTSGGCFELYGPREQGDQVAIVEALAAQPESTGSIGMYGHSYEAAAAMQAAVAAPPALRAVITSGTVVDPYLNLSTPEGAVRTSGNRYSTDASVGFYPQALFMARHGVPRPNPVDPPDDAARARFVAAIEQRACPHVATMASKAVDITVTEDRDERFWAERRVTERLGKVRAATLVAQGFDDGHFYQDDELWTALRRAPKRMLLGQWGHRLPRANELEGASWAGEGTTANGRKVAGFARVKLEWFDHWLRQSASAAKRNADRVRVGIVDHQASDGSWHEADSWPPAGDDVVLRLDDVRIAGPGQNVAPRPRQFVSAPDPLTAAFEATNAMGSEWLPFAGPTCGPDGAFGLRWQTEPATTRWHLAGNPTLRVTYDSSQSGGLVMWQLLDISPGASCSAGGPVGMTGIARAGMDLRFRHRNFVADGPTPGERDTISIRFYNDSYVLEPGHRLALVAGYGDAYDRSTDPRFTPTITIHEGELALRVMGDA